MTTDSLFQTIPEQFTPMHLLRLVEAVEKILVADLFHCNRSKPTYD